MKSNQLLFQNNQWSEPNIPLTNLTMDNSLVLLFVDRVEWEKNKEISEMLRSQIPNSNQVLVSTSGSIANNSQVTDEPVANIIHFEKSTVKCKKYQLERHKEKELGEQIVSDLMKDDLQHILIFSVGNDYNIGNLIQGINETMTQTKPVTISGGIAGDQGRFINSIVGLNGQNDDVSLVAIGLYGEELTVETNSKGGWIPFGPKRIVTKSDENILYQVDGLDALEIYKNYLGPYAEELPEAALLFPLEVLRKGESDSLVRTILSVNHDENSMTFAGDIPEGSTIRLMRSIKDHIIQASGEAYKDIMNSHSPDLSLLISCVGRRLVLGQRTDEELEEIQKNLTNENTLLCGFYSYGEISMNQLHSCDLYNQTMTITNISEE